MAARVSQERQPHKTGALHTDLDPQPQPAGGLQKQCPEDKDGQGVCPAAWLCPLRWAVSYLDTVKYLTGRSCVESPFLPARISLTY